MSLTQPISNGASQTSSAKVCAKTTLLCDTTQQTLLREIKACLPAMVASAVQKELEPALKKRDELKLEIADLKKAKLELTNKVEGFKKQVDKWLKVAKVMEEETIPSLIDKVIALEKSWKIKEKTIANKTKQFISTQNKVQKEIEELSNLQNEWEKLLKAKTDGTDIVNIEKSQQFVSDEYDEFREKQKTLVKKVTSLEEKVAKQAAKSEHNSNYSRWDSLELDGIPRVPVDEYGNENCKEMVINICKELHYWLPPSSISTAHRLKKHPSKRGPPAMIVKFNNRDIRNDVFELRSHIKNKSYWNCYNIKKLYINESLTPETRKLFYETRLCAKQMEKTHGRIYTWTFKGEIYVRKNVENGPKRKISSENYLEKIKNGDISLDPPKTLENSEAHNSIVVIEEVMAEYTAPVAVDA